MRKRVYFSITSADAGSKASISSISSPKKCTLKAISEYPGKTSTIAVPVLGKEGNLIASIGLVYFRIALEADEVVEQFLLNLQATAQAIGREFENAQALEE